MWGRETGWSVVLQLQIRLFHDLMILRQAMHG